MNTFSRMILILALLNVCWACDEREIEPEIEGTWSSTAISQGNRLKSIKEFMSADTTSPHVTTSYYYNPDGQLSLEVRDNVQSGISHRSFEWLDLNNFEIQNSHRKRIVTFNSNDYPLGLATPGEPIDSIKYELIKYDSISLKHYLWDYISEDWGVENWELKLDGKNVTEINIESEWHRRTTTIKYDDKSNMYESTSITYLPFDSWILQEYLSSGWTNNILEEVTEFYNKQEDKLSVSTTQFKYQYNDLGYPVRVEWIHTSQNGEYKSYWVIEYE